MSRNAPRALDLEAGHIDGVLGGTYRRTLTVAYAAHSIHLRGRDQFAFPQLPVALELGVGKGRLRLLGLQVGARAFQTGTGSGEVLARLFHAAGIQRRRRVRLHPEDHLALLHLVADLEGDPLQKAGNRRGYRKGVP
jgi:hypothetical protein